VLRPRSYATMLLVYILECALLLYGRPEVISLRPRIPSESMRRAFVI
jgi:hypothetical protein